LLNGQTHDHGVPPYSPLAGGTPSAKILLLPAGLVTRVEIAAEWRPRTFHREGRRSLRAARAVLSDQRQDLPGYEEPSVPARRASIVPLPFSRCQTPTMDSSDEPCAVMAAEGPVFVCGYSAARTPQFEQYCIKPFRDEHGGHGAGRVQARVPVPSCAAVVVADGLGRGDVRLAAAGHGRCLGGRRQRRGPRAQLGQVFPTSRPGSCAGSQPVPSRPPWPARRRTGSLETGS
jgi:hypothetical protein